MAENHSGLAFVLGIILGGSCLIPRGCDYRQPEIRQIDNGTLVVTEHPDKVTIYEKQPNGNYIPKSDSR